MSGQLEKTVRTLIEDIETREGDLLADKKTVNGLCRRLGRPGHYVLPVAKKTPVRAGQVVHADPFANEPSIPAAVQAFLRWSGKAAGPQSFKTIFDMLTYGGFRFGGGPLEKEKGSVERGSRRGPFRSTSRRRLVRARRSPAQGSRATYRPTDSSHGPTMTRSCRTLIAAGLLASACATTPGLKASPPQRRLLVTMVIDQFAAWIANQRLEKLPQDGGFHRLRSEGVWLQAMQYDYAATDTAAGHLALYTGLPPRDTGIPRNEVCVEPPSGPTDHISSFATEIGDSATRLLAPPSLQATADQLRGIRLALAPGVMTLADQLRADTRLPARIISVSLKDRAAIPGGGRHPDAVLWYDKKLDAFVTARSFASAFPPWANRNSELIEQLRQQPWSVLDPAWISSAGVLDDRPTEEGNIGCGVDQKCAGGFGITFPHAFPVELEARKLAFRASPRADEAILSLAVSALDQVPGSDAPDGLTLLAVSLSGNDYIGHAFTADSVESWDETRRLDQLLGTFFAALDQRYGANGWSILLTADHGAMSTADGVKDASGKTIHSVRMPVHGSADTPGLMDIIGGEARKQLSLPKGRPALCPFTDPYLEFTKAAQADPAFGAFIESLVAHPPPALRALGVERIVDTASPLHCGVAGTVDDFICHTVAPDSRHLLLFIPTEGAFFDPETVAGFGTSHGTPYAYDRTVPLLVRAPGAVAHQPKPLTTPVPFTVFRQTAWCLLSAAGRCDQPWAKEDGSSIP